MPKIRIHVLSTYKTPNSHAFGYPLLINRPFFDKQGIRILFFERLNDRIYNCDIIFINSKFFRTWYPQKKQEIYDVLQNFKKKIRKVIWFDTTDSTGTTQFNVMPFVDGYYKSQVLKDRSLYTKTFYGYRIFTDYYNKVFGAQDIDRLDQSKSLSATLQPEDAHKLHVSWNDAMYNWNNLPSFFGYLVTRHLPSKRGYKVRFIDPSRERKMDVLGRIGLSHARNRNTIRYPRERIAEILREKFNVDISIIPRKEYLDEIKNSKIGVSPFGLGEISCRDFEIVINGALLFKQDMSHLETWPPLYVDNETYIPFAWDLRNFEEKLRTLLNNRERIIEISKRAQELYAYYLYGGGRLEFCNKVLNIIR